MKSTLRLEAKTPRGWTPVHYAAVGGAGEALRALLSRGAAPRARNSDGETADDILDRVR